jgi:plastocyanin
MDPMKSRRWIAAAALAAAVVFLVMVTGEHGPAAPNATPAPVSSSGAVLASDGGPPENDDGDDGGGGNGGGNGGGGAEGADREEVIGALQGLLDALGISADELAEGAENSGCGNGEQDKSDSGNGNNNSSGNDKGNDDGNGNGNGEANGSGCEQSEPASADRSASVTITIKGFAFGQPVTVAPGATVEVMNTDAAPHNVTAADGSFKTSNLNQDETATFTAPTTPGRYEFSCTLHPEMTGTLIVEGSGGEQGRSRSSEPAQRGSSGGDHDSSRQHQSTAPGRENTSGGSADGY